VPIRRVRTGAAYVADPGGGPQQWQVTYEDQEVTGSYVADPAGGPAQWQYDVVTALDQARSLILVGDSFAAGAYQIFAPDSSVVTSNVATVTFYTESDAGRIIAPPIGGHVFGFRANNADDQLWRMATVGIDSVSRTLTPSVAQADVTMSGALQMLNTCRIMDTHSFMPMLNSLLGWRFDILRQPAGYGGVMAAEMLALVNDIAVSSGAAWAHVSCGLNDLYAVEGSLDGSPDPVVAIADDIMESVDALIAADIRPILQTVPPVVVEAPAAVRNAIVRLNSRLTTLAAARPTVVLVDVWSLLATGTPLVLADNDTYDRVHLTPRASYTVANAILAQFQSLLSERLTSILANGTSGTLYSTQSRAIFAGTGGTLGTGVTGTVADGWTVSRLGSPTCAASIESGADMGDWQRIVVSGVADAGANLVAATVHGNIASGDEVYASAKIRLASMTAVRLVRLAVNMTIGGTLTPAVSTMASEMVSGLGASDRFPQDNRTIVLRTPNFKINTVPTNCQPVITVQFGDTGGATIDVSQFGIFKA